MLVCERCGGGKGTVSSVVMEVGAQALVLIVVELVAYGSWGQALLST